MQGVHADHPESCSGWLLPHECTQLREALRRDMRQELARAWTDPAAADYHMADEE